MLRGAPSTRTPKCSTSSAELYSLGANGLLKTPVVLLGIWTVSEAGGSEAGGCKKGDLPDAPWSAVYQSPDMLEQFRRSLLAWSEWAAENRRAAYRPLEGIELWPPENMPQQHPSTNSDLPAR